MDISEMVQQHKQALGRTKATLGTSRTAGATGTNGSNGSNGTNGTNGTKGTNGTNGIIGNTGTARTVPIDSPWGEMTARIEADGGLSGLWFVGQRYYPAVPLGLWIEDFEGVAPVVRETVEKLEVQLEAYARGGLQEFDLPLVFRGTDFQVRVWALLLKIPYGQTVTYGELARTLAAEDGRASMSAQAVGGAVGRNPISIVVPCHRVIGQDGTLTGYAGGLDKKKALLSLEGRT